MTGRTPRFLTLGALAGTLACAGAPAPISGSGSLLSDPTEVTLRVGERHDIGGTPLAVTFTGVPRDTRCPVDVTCVSEGSFEVNLGLGIYGTTPPVGAPDQLLTVQGSHPVERERIRFEVLALEPLPHAGVPIDPERYVVKLRLSQAEH